MSMKKNNKPVIELGGDSLLRSDFEELPLHIWTNLDTIHFLFVPMN